MNSKFQSICIPRCLPVLWSQDTKALLKNWRKHCCASTCEIQRAQHMISMKKLRFSSCLRAKVSRQGPQRTALEHSLGYIVQSYLSCVFCVCLKYHILGNILNKDVPFYMYISIYRYVGWVQPLLLPSKHCLALGNITVFNAVWFLKYYIGIY